LEKTIFQNFFLENSIFSQHFFGGNFFAEFSPKFSPEKNVRNISPLKNVQKIGPRFTRTAKMDPFLETTAGQKFLALVAKTDRFFAVRVNPA
jgi:hypothetical protein